MKHARFANIVVALLMLAALLPLPAAKAQAQTQPLIQEGARNPEAKYVPGEIVVKFVSELPEAESQSKAEALAGTISATVKKVHGDTALLKMDESIDVYATAERIEQEPDIKFAEPNFIYGHDTGPTPPTPNPNNPTPPPESEEEKEMKVKKKAPKVPMFPNDIFNSWANSYVQHPIVWSEPAKSGDVCLIDTGVDWNHPDLKGKIIKGHDYVNDDNVPMDDNGHGTFIAGIIAATQNNNIGIAGISNGKVVAIKALGAEGSGSSFDIGWAIYDCFLSSYAAINSRVKVINLSLGGFGQSQYLYEAIYGAINAGKLVVAASANVTTDYLSYPAAWSSPLVGNPWGDPSIANGFIGTTSIAAPYDYLTWVDKNGNRVMDSGETYSGGQCATSFASYGPWVELAVPGEAMYSLTPVTDPFYDNYYYGAPEGYAYMDGSSFASAVTSAAAARVWSVYPNLANTSIESKILSSGSTVNTGNDGFNFSQPGYTGFDPNWGYWQTVSETDMTPLVWSIQGQTVTYGDIFPYTTGGSTYYTQLAPFCWPANGVNFGASQDSSNTRILNVAAAMNRYGYRFFIRDANTGLPITGATAVAKDFDTGIVKTTAYTDSKTSPYVYMINLIAGNKYIFTVNKPGYTAGATPIFEGWWKSSSPGHIYTDYRFNVGIPQLGKNTAVVANYNYPTNSYRENDLVVFLPDFGYSDYWGAVGPNALWNNNHNLITNYFYDGSLAYHPNARYMTYNDLTMETVLIKNYPGSTHQYYPGEYQIFVNSYDADSINWAAPVIRIWRGGKIVKMVRFTDGYGCGSGQTWWKAAGIYWWGGSTYYYTYNNCGTSSLWPY